MGASSQQHCSRHLEPVLYTRALQVIEQEIDGQRCEPYELVDVELPEEYSGSVIDMLGMRKGAMKEMGTISPEGIISMVYEVPSRAMAGAQKKEWSPGLTLLYRYRHFPALAMHQSMPR